MHDYDGENPLTYANSPLENTVKSLVFGDSLVMGSNTVNSIRVTYNDTQIFKPGVQLMDFKDVGIRSTVLLPGFIRVGVAGAFNLGGTVPGSTPTKAFQFSDDLSLVRGSHQFGVGVNIIHDESHGVIYQQAVGNFQFTGQVTGLGLADFVLGRTNGFTLGSITNAFIHSNYIGSYVQDAWRITPRVTLNAGLRWDPYFPPYAVLPIFGHFDRDRFDRGLRSTTFPNGPAGMIFQGDPEFLPGDSIGFRQWNDFAPRLAVVIDPQGDGRSSLRAAYGRFYRPAASLQLQRLRRRAAERQQHHVDECDARQPVGELPRRRSLPDRARARACSSRTSASTRPRRSISRHPMRTSGT